MHGVLCVVAVLGFQFGSFRVSILAPFLIGSMMFDGTAESPFGGGVGKLRAVFSQFGAKLLGRGLNRRVGGEPFMVALDLLKLMNSVASELDPHLFGEKDAFFVQYWLKVRGGEEPIVRVCKERFDDVGIAVEGQSHELLKTEDDVISALGLPLFEGRQPIQKSFRRKADPASVEIRFSCVEAMSLGAGLDLEEKSTVGPVHYAPRVLRALTR